MKKTISILILTLSLGAGLWLFQDKISKIFFDLKNDFLFKKTAEETFRNSLETKTPKTKEILPPPLRAKQESPQALLTKEGVIKWTNFWREKNGLPPLKENQLLNLSAEMKVEDMFANQYFDHYSPNGESLANLVQKTGYQYILIGENLALGNFLNDETLVKGWMDSPEHRENILNAGYQEIGIAVKKNTFNGKDVWMAVQHFGLPLSTCSQPDENLKREIEEEKAEIEKLAENLKTLKEEIRTVRPKRGDDLKQKIEEYNDLVAKYNALIEKVKSLVDNYNSQVNSFNQCVSGWQ